jgi:hypothetical protein
VSVLLDHRPSTALAALAGLGPDWHVLQPTSAHAAARGVDYLVIGLAGVITLDTNHLPGSRAWVSDRCVRVNGHTTRYLGDSRLAAARVSRALTSELRRTVEVSSAVVLVDLDDFSVKQMPHDVHVTTMPRLAGWLGSLPATTTPDDVVAIHAAATRTSAWQSVMPPANRS